MHVILHAGAHATDENRLLKCLMRNEKAFSEAGVAVPKTSRYRRLLQQAMHSLGQGKPSADARDVVLDAILDQDPEGVDRLILSNENFFAVPKIAVGRGYAYPKAGPRLASMQALFEGDQLELFIGLRNPATWFPAVFAGTPHADFESFLNGTGVFDLRWSELIARIRREAPSVAITTWCNEDTPLIWGQLIREAGGVLPNQKIVGAFDLLGEIMSKEGMKRFRTYLHEHPVMTEMQRRRVISAFLDKYAIEDEIEEEVDIPGWSEELIDTLTEIYEEDVYAISRMPGVNFIEP